MSWPNSQTAYLATGYTTIRWGTDGIMNNANNGTGGGVLNVSGLSPASAGFYIVESVRANDRVDTLEIEQGTGLIATRIQLWQGRRYTITVVDDTFMTSPTPSGFVWIQDVIGGVSSPLLYKCRVIDNGYGVNRKQEGKRELTVEVLTLIELSGTLPGN